MGFPDEVAEAVQGCSREGCLSEQSTLRVEAGIEQGCGKWGDTPLVFSRSVA